MQVAAPFVICHNLHGLVLKCKDALLLYLCQDMTIRDGDASYTVLKTEGLLNGIKLVGVKVTFNRGTKTVSIRDTHDFYAPSDEEQ